MTYHTQGIVLKREPWREAARLYTVYTREAGKVLAAGHGTRKLLSKLGAHLEPFSSVELLLARGRRTDVVCGAVMSRDPEAIARDGRRYLLAGFVAEAVDHFVKMGERDEDLWALLDGAFADFAALPAARLPDRLTEFVWDFMSHLGYRPKLEECLECGRDVRGETVRFLPVRGTAACRACPLSERDLAGAVTMASDATTLEAALAFLEARLDRPLNSFPLLRAHGMMGPVTLHHSIL
jgi:DNA repair protein RecO (recombination protein O)